MAMKQLGAAALFCVLVTTVAAPRVRAAACSVPYQGGPVLSNVEVVEVYWTSGVATQAQDVLPGFYTSVLDSSYMDWLSEYDTAGMTNGSNQFIGRGTFKKKVTITPSAGGTSLTQAQVEGELEAQISAGNLPAPSFDGGGHANTFYAVDFPPGTTIADAGGNQSCVFFCGTWGQVHVGGKVAPFGIFPDITTGPCTGGCGSAANVADNITFVHSLILLNVVTDPQVAFTGGSIAWASTSNTPACAGNIGDVCLGKTGTVGAYTVAKAWSNRQAACVLSGAATPICAGALAPACRGCTVSDNGTGCTGTTPSCDTAPASSTYGLCVPGGTDAGAADAGGTDAADTSSGASDAADAPGASDAADAPVASDAAGGGTCVPGQQVACACVGGGAGAQACLATGAAYGRCQCADGGAADAGAANSSSGCSCGISHSPASSVVELAALGALIALARARRRRS